MYWPALLLAAGYEPPRQLFVHGYLIIDQQKISKSLGNAIDPLDLIDVYGADAVRFWCARQVSFGQDGNVTLDSFQERYDRELANDLGNLLSRTTAMIARYRDGTLARSPGPGAIDAEALRAALVERLDRFDITAALEEIWQAVRRLNQYVEANAPWELAKDESKAGELDAVLYDLADGLVAVAVAVSAYLPETAPRILQALGQPADLSLDRVARTDRRGGRGDRGSLTALPAGRRADPGVIDTHAHLDALDDPDGAVARAADAGVAKILTVGTTVEGCRTALELADAHEGVFAILGIHPHEAASEGGRLGELEPLLRHPSAVAVGETGLDFYRDLSPRAAQRKAFRVGAGARRAAGEAGGGPHSRGGRRHAGRPAQLRRHSRPALLLVRRAPARRARARLLRLVRRERHLPERLGAAACCCPGARPIAYSRRPTAPTWRRNRSGAGRTSRRT